MNKIKMLYISCHAILEYNEVSLFNEIGIDVFCLGSYLDPTKPVDPIRPTIPGMKNNPELMSLACPREKLTKELVSKFDLIYVMHIPEWLTENWDVIKDKTVIWRSIGQSISKVENKLKDIRKDIYIVRYSPLENTIPNYIGEDAIIRFHADPDEFKDWNGSDRKIITFSQGMPTRGPACSYEIFRDAIRDMPTRLYGPKNEAAGNINGGMLSYEDLKKELRNSRVYFYTGTHPASYTLNFIEAWLTGTPVVAVGSKWGNGHYFNVNTYEVPSMIQNGINGFCSDDIDELRSYCKALLDDDDLAKRISVEGRKKAVEYFGKDKIKKEWIDFFQKVVNNDR